MKINRHDRTFARQVQVDLLALSDADLFQMIQLWVNGETPYPSHVVLEETLRELGYTLRKENEDHLAQSPLQDSDDEDENAYWVAPTPLQLRELLTQMDTKCFAQNVLSLAYQSLHTLHPEWSEGATFNAHLANHLRGLLQSPQSSSKTRL